MKCRDRVEYIRPDFQSDLFGRIKVVFDDIAVAGA
jgi:hypothetical protein